MAKTTTGTQEHKVEELPKEKVMELMKKYGRKK
jgi:D-aminopeptidase